MGVPSLPSDVHDINITIMDLPDAKSINGFAACGRIHNYETLYATTDAHCFHFVIFVGLRILIKVDKTKQTKHI